ncbi:MAG: DNA topoisomerase IV subunit B, partial [Thermomicrobiales bacterium]|nr:DNA topoisomerase IV subunit B [Thermomicrobiales bacterium]
MAQAVDSKPTKPTYDASNIEVLEGLEAVRRRPGMYIGSTDIRGLHHLITEVVDNAVDEALGGFCDTIRITIHPDSSVTVEDNGRGIPVKKHPKMNTSALEVVMTVLHAGGKFGSGGYSMSSGLHGVGVSVVNGLSEWMISEVRRDGGLYRQEYRKGIPTGAVKKVAKIDPSERGTTQTWMPDATIFDTLDYNYDMLAQRLREMAYLMRGLRIVFIDERSDREMTFYFEGGINSFVRHLNKAKNPVHPKPFYIYRQVGDFIVEAAIQYNDSYGESIHSFANNVNTIDGGTHLTGFRSALTRT